MYTDGAYSSLRDQGGIAFVIVKDDKELFSYSKTFNKTTNNRMEILAAIIALESIKNPSNVKIISDSQYLVNTMMLNWNKTRNNSDLWDRLDNIVSNHLSVVFEWVRGHDVNQWNNKCDILANRSSQYEEKN